MAAQIRLETCLKIYSCQLWTIFIMLGIYLITTALCNLPNQPLAEVYNDRNALTLNN